MDSKNTARFAIGFCAGCAEHVLTYVDLDEDGSLIHKCIDCETTLNDDLQLVSSMQLAEHGYAVAEAKAGGCGSGCGSGGCGVRPPAAH